MQPVKDWIYDHDDRWSFTILYVGGAILLSIYLNLFWVAMLMLVNFALKLTRNFMIVAPRPVLLAIWQIKLDIALIAFAITITLYAEHVFAILGISRLARAGQAMRGAHLAARFGVIKRGLRVLFLIVDDLARLVHAFVRAIRKQKTLVNIDEHILEEITPHPTEPWTNPQKGDFFSIGFGTLCLLLILMAPLLTGIPFIDIAAQVAHELSP